MIIRRRLLFKRSHDSKCIMWEFVDKVVYINLDERTDRLEKIEEFIKPFGDKAIRFPAIKHDKGIVGCVLSHIAVLKLTLENGWNNVLILEDDVSWNDIETGYSKLESIVSSPFDVVMLGGTVVTYYPKTFRLVRANTTSAYIVNAHYIPNLISNFEEGLEKMLMYGYGKNGENALDAYWCSLQSRDNWYILVPPLVYQYPDYSSIEKKDVDYRKYFNGYDNTALL